MDMVYEKFSLAALIKWFRWKAATCYFEHGAQDRHLQQLVFANIQMILAEAMQKN
jgi:hypothetical protein